MPKGFGKNYFTLAAIQASVVQHHLDATSVRIRASHLIINTLESDELEEEPLEALLLTPATTLVKHAGHCNCYYHRVTRNLILQNPKAKHSVKPYLYANSVTSPPLIIPLLLA